jgi:hypothetical protein
MAVAKRGLAFYESYRLADRFAAAPAARRLALRILKGRELFASAGARSVRVLAAAARWHCCRRRSCKSCGLRELPTVNIEPRPSARLGCDPQCTCTGSRRAQTLWQTLRQARRDEEGEGGKETDFTTTAAWASGGLLVCSVFCFLGIVGCCSSKRLIAGAEFAASESSSPPPLPSRPLSARHHDRRC